MAINSTLQTNAAKESFIKWKRRANGLSIISEKKRMVQVHLPSTDHFEWNYCRVSVPFIPVKLLADDSRRIHLNLNFQVCVVDWMTDASHAWWRSSDDDADLSCESRTHFVPILFSGVRVALLELSAGSTLHGEYTDLWWQIEWRWCDPLCKSVFIEKKKKFFS